MIEDKSPTNFGRGRNKWTCPAINPDMMVCAGELVLDCKSFNVKCKKCNYIGTSVFMDGEIIDLSEAFRVSKNLKEMFRRKFFGDYVRNIVKSVKDEEKYIDVEFT